MRYAWLWLPTMALAVMLVGCKKDAEEGGATEYTDEAVCEATWKNMEGADPDAKDHYVEQCVEKIQETKALLGDEWAGFAECIVDADGDTSKMEACNDAVQDTLDAARDDALGPTAEAVCEASVPADEADRDTQLKQCSKMMGEIRTELGERWRPFAECALENEGDPDKQARCVPPDPEVTASSSGEEICKTISPVGKDSEAEIERCEAMLREVRTRLGVPAHDEFVECTLAAKGDEAALEACVSEIAGLLQRSRE